VQCAQEVALVLLARVPELVLEDQIGWKLWISVVQSCIRYHRLVGFFNFLVENKLVW